MLPLLPLPLTSDHTPARADEAARIVAAGGSIAPKRLGSLKQRVGGELEVTRSFGDVGYVEQVSSICVVVFVVGVCRC